MELEKLSNGTYNHNNAAAVEKGFVFYTDTSEIINIKHNRLFTQFHYELASCKQ